MLPSALLVPVATTLASSPSPLDELEGELAVLEVAPGQELGRGDLVGDTELARIRLVAVVELRLVGSIQLMLYHELTLAVVGDGRLDGVGLAVVGDAVAGVARDLAQRVGVLAGLVVSDFVHDNRAVSGVLTGGDDLVALDELEGELAGGKRAPGQELGRLDLVGDAGLSGGQIVGILELGSLGILQDMLGLERAVALIGDGGHDGVSLAVVGDALAGGSAVDFAQCVGMRSGLVILDGAHRDVTAGVVGAGGDDLVALDKLEGELAGGKLCARSGTWSR